MGVGFSHRRAKLAAAPPPFNHPLAGGRQYNEQYNEDRAKLKEMENEALFLRRPIQVQNDIYTKGDDIVVGYEGTIFRRIFGRKTRREFYLRRELQ